MNQTSRDRSKQPSRRFCGPGVLIFDGNGFWFIVVGANVDEQQSVLKVSENKRIRWPFLGCLGLALTCVFWMPVTDFFEQRRKTFVVVNDVRKPVLFKKSRTSWEEFRYGDYLAERTMFPVTASFRLKIEGKEVDVNCRKHGKWKDGDLCQVLLSEVSP